MEKNTSKKVSKGKKSSKKEKQTKIEKKPEIQEKKQENFIPETDLEIELASGKTLKPEDMDSDEEFGFSDISSADIPELDFGKGSSPSLNRIRTSREGSFNLEEFLENSPLNQEKFAWQEEFDPLKYTAGINKEGPQYLNNYDGLIRTVENVNTDSLRIWEDRKANFQFNPMQKQESRSIETYVPIQKRDASEISKDRFKINPEIKYTPSEN
jgi:hypothetical protein